MASRLIPLVVLLAAGPLRAEGPEPVALSIEEARRLAAELNPGLLAAQAGAEAREAAADAADRAWWPSLRLSSDWTRSNLPAAVFAARHSPSTINI